MIDEKNEQIQEDEELTLPEVAAGEEDATDWKELALKQQGINKRLKTKLEKLKIEKKPELSSEKPDNKEIKDFTFSTGDKALLKVYKDIQTEDEVALAQDWVKKYQCSIEEMINDEVFSRRLEKIRESKQIDEAAKVKTNRSPGSGANTQVDYWLAKYEQTKNLGDVPPELRREVLNTKLKIEEEKLRGLRR